MTIGSINFGAGPAKLPSEVLAEAAGAVIAYGDSGYSIMELPHRSREFRAILEECNELVRHLCGLGDEYEILWMQGGGRAQFGMVPMNFLAPGEKAGYIDSGHWAHQAIATAKSCGKNPVIIGSSAHSNYDRLPAIPSTFSDDLAYLHLTTNNTIYGTQYHDDLQTGIPLIADMSSDILSMPRDYRRYGMFYAVAQKNLGTPGNTLVAIHKSMLEKTQPGLAPAFCYASHVKENNLLCTPNVSGIYVTLLVLRWIAATTLETIFNQNLRKAEKLYDFLDKSNIFMPHVKEASHRSQMNVCFTAATPELEQRALTLCRENNIYGIEGHRTVGGFRVSLYNAVTLEEVDRVITVLQNT